MCAMHPEELDRLARETVLQVCWSQWTGLGSPASEGQSWIPNSMIDIEALLVASIALSDYERRLEDMARWWAYAGSRLTSLQRFRNLNLRFPDQVGHRSLEAFSGMAVAAGDKRWGRHKGAPTQEGGREPRGPGEPNLLDPCALWLRVRAGFGVGSKADTLAFLVGMQGAPATARSIAYATGYSSVSIRQAVEEMALARLIRGTKSRPSEYLAPLRPWTELLELDDPGEASATGGGFPPWRYWSETLAFLLGVMHWSEQVASSSNVNPHVSASKARDLLEKHAKAFMLNHVPVRPPASFPGLQAPEGLARTTEAVVSWVQVAI